MTCVICKNGETLRGSTALTLHRHGRTIVFKGVPAEVCDNCGESYVDGTTAAQLLAEAESHASGNVELEIHRFAIA